MARWAWQSQESVLCFAVSDGPLESSGEKSLSKGRRSARTTVIVQAGGLGWAAAPRQPLLHWAQVLHPRQQDGLAFLLPKAFYAS